MAKLQRLRSLGYRLRGAEFVEIVIGAVESAGVISRSSLYLSLSLNG